MKLSVLLFITLCIFAVVQADFIIDSFQSEAGAFSDQMSFTPASLFSPPGGNIQGQDLYDLSAYARFVFNNISNVTVKQIPDIYYAFNWFPSSGFCFGGVRRVVLQSVTDNVVAPQTNVGVSIGNGVFTEDVGPDLRVAVAINYVGNYTPDFSQCNYSGIPTSDLNLLCPQQNSLGPLLSQSYDITEGGIDGAMAFTILSADQAGVPYTFTFLSSTTAASSRIVRSVAPGVSGFKRYSETENDEDLIMSWDVPLAEPRLLKNGKRATSGRRYVVPFNIFGRAAGYASEADFTQIRGISIQVSAVLGLDTAFGDFRTTILTELTKNASIVESVAVDGIAEPNEVINYTLRVEVSQGLSEATNVQNIFVYDYPGRNYGSNNYATLVPGSLSLAGYSFNQVNCSNSTDLNTCVQYYTPQTDNFNATILTSANDPYFANRIAILFPSISSGSYVDISYQMVLPPLPCQLQTCASGCTLSTTIQNTITGGCYCQINQGRVCTAIARNNTVSIAQQIDNSTNFQTGIARCSPSQDGNSVTVTYLTVTPIGTKPNPALTIFANPTQKANGVFPGGNVTYTVTLTNNQTRSSDSFVVNLTPDQYTTCAVGPNTANPNFTADASTGNPVYSVAGGLQYGQSLTFSITCTVVANLACGVNNTTMNAAINFGPNTVNCAQLTTADDFGSDSVPIIGAPSITLSKTSTNNITYGAGASTVASFTINYSNVGQRPASGVVITETVPAVLAQYYQSSDNPSFVSAGGNNYSYTLSLTAGQSSSVTFNFRVPPVQTDCTTGSYINTVSSNAVCGAAALTATAFVGVNAVPDMSVTISNAPTSVAPGATVCYTITYQNIGYRVAQNVFLQIPVPAYTTFASSGSSAFTQVGTSNVYTLQVGDVQAQAAAATATFCVTANSNSGCTPAFSTNVNVTSFCAAFPEINLSNNFASTGTTSIAGTITLTLSKVAQVGGVTVSSANTSSVLVYSLSGSNTGNTQAQNVTLYESLPSGVTLSGSNTGFVAGAVAGQYSYSIGNLNAGASFGPILFSVVVPSFVNCPAPSISNTAFVQETCVGATANASSTVTINAQPVLTLTAQAPTSVTLVANSTNQVCVSATYGNTGTQVANNATLTLSFDSIVTPVSGTNNGWVLANGVLTLSVGNLNVGATTSPSACFNVPTPVNCPVNQTNFVFTLASPCAINPASVSSPTYATIIASPVFVITKSNNIVGQATPGGSVTYTITYANVGTQIATNVVLTESVPSQINPAANSNFNCNGQSCTYNVGTLSPTQGTQTVSFSGSISSSIAGLTTVTNNVAINSSPCAASASATSTFTVAGFPNLRIVKSDGGVSVTPGDYIYYTITYVNDGDSVALNTVITDILPAFAKFNRTLTNAAWNCTDGAGAGTVCSVSVGTVNPGQSGTVPLVVQTDDWIRCGTNFTENYAFISTTVQESNYNDNNASVRTPIYGEPDLVITKVANRTNARRDRAGPNDLITYNITYTNVGVRDATNAVIYETVPAYTTYVASQSSAWSCADGSPAGTVCTFNTSNPFYPVMPGMDNMMAYGQLLFSVRVVSSLPPEAHITSNCVSINNTCGECNPYDNMACYTINLYGLPDLVLNQSAICRSVHWYIEWQNVGDQGASNVVVTDNVPAGTVFNAAASDSRWSCNSNAASAQFGQCTLNVGDVASGAGGSAVFVTNPQNGTTLTMFTNTGSVTGVGRNPDPTPENNQDTATVGFEGCPDACDSCCPVANECCPDKTEVLFNFRGILQGIDSCSAGSSS